VGFKLILLRCRIFEVLGTTTMQVLQVVKVEVVGQLKGRMLGQKKILGRGSR